MKGVWFDHLVGRFISYRTENAANSNFYCNWSLLSVTNFLKNSFTTLKLFSKGATVKTKRIIQEKTFSNVLRIYNVQVTDDIWKHVWITVKERSLKNHFHIEHLWLLITLPLKVLKWPWTLRVIVSLVVFDYIYLNFIFINLNSFYFFCNIAVFFRYCLYFYALITPWFIKINKTCYICMMHSLHYIVYMCLSIIRMWNRK